MQYQRLSAVAIPARRIAPSHRARLTNARRPSRIRVILDELRWRRPSLQPEIVTVAEVAECGCPDWCDRDHENE